MEISVLVSKAKQPDALVQRISHMNIGNKREKLSQAFLFIKLIEQQ
jgi:hypothetical protein